MIEPDPRRLCAYPLSESEKERLLNLMGQLARFLSAPGDWGYDTRLGDFTIELLSLRDVIRAAPVRPSREA